MLYLLNGPRDRASPILVFKKKNGKWGGEKTNSLPELRSLESWHHRL